MTECLQFEYTGTWLARYALVMHIDATVPFADPYADDVPQSYVNFG